MDLLSHLVYCWEQKDLLMEQLKKLVYCWEQLDFLLDLPDEVELLFLRRNNQLIKTCLQCRDQHAGKDQSTHKGDESLNPDHNQLIEINSGQVATK